MKLPVIPSISFIFLTSSISLSIAGSCPSVDFIKNGANWTVHAGALVLKNVPEIGTMSTNDDSGSILFIQQNIGDWKATRAATNDYLRCVYEPNFIFTSNNTGYSLSSGNNGFSQCPNSRTPNKPLEFLRTRVCTFRM